MRRHTRWAPVALTVAVLAGALVGRAAVAAVPPSVVQALLLLNGTPTYVASVSPTSTPATTALSTNTFYFVTCTTADAQVLPGTVTTTTGIPLSAGEKLFFWSGSSTTLGHVAASGTPTCRLYSLNL